MEGRRQLRPVEAEGRKLRLPGWNPWQRYLREKLLPMSPDQFVTYVPGRSRGTATTTAD
jgi:hypothetical protein